MEPLHVTNGDSAATTIEATSLPGEALSWDDVLHEGPLAAGPPERLRELRAKHLAAQGWGPSGEIALSFRRRDEALAAALATGRPVVVWLEHDLYDQLQLLQILDAVARAGAGVRSVELLVVGDVAGRPDFHGLGELTAPELEALWPARVPLTDEVLELGRAGWATLCGPDPRALAAFAARPLAGLPYLGAALLRLLEELPDVASGLSRTERQLLEAVAGGAATPVAVFLENARREEAPFAGDAWVWLRLHELGTGAARLVEQPSGEPVPPPPPRGDADAFLAAELRPTGAGRAALAGGLDRVAQAGIDRWLGGTHLRPGNVWRWDSASRRVVAPG